jgi:hypothetical protein
MAMATVARAMATALRVARAMAMAIATATAMWLVGDKDGKDEGCRGDGNGNEGGRQ